MSKRLSLLYIENIYQCAYRIMKNWNIDKYFDKLYVSSVYGANKEEKVLFDYLINDYNIKHKEAIFVDDKEELLDISYKKG